MGYSRRSCSGASSCRSRCPLIVAGRPGGDGEHDRARDGRGPDRRRRTGQLILEGLQRPVPDRDPVGALLSVVSPCRRRTRSSRLEPAPLTPWARARAAAGGGLACTRCRSRSTGSATPPTGGPRAASRRGFCKHVELSGSAVAIACAIAVPLGLFIGHTGRARFLAVSIANIGRAVPSFGDPRDRLRRRAEACCLARVRLHADRRRARAARDPADPHEHLRRGRRRSTRHGGGRPWDGHERTRGAAAAGGARSPLPADHGGDSDRRGAGRRHGDALRADRRRHARPLHRRRLRAERQRDADRRLDPRGAPGRHHRGGARHPRAPPDAAYRSRA